MSLRISRAVHAAMLAEAARDPMREVCGLLLGNEVVTRIVPTANVAADPATRFEIDPTPLFSAIRAERAGGPRLIGYYHSHPNGRAAPSERDRQQANGDVRAWLIVAGGEVTGWRRTEADVFQEIVLHLVD